METNRLSAVTAEPTPVDSLVQTANEVIGKKSMFIQNLLREDILNLALVPIDPIQGDHEIKSHADHVRIGHQEVRPLIARIPGSAFENLFLDAGAAYNTGNRYVSGLRISFGLESEAAGIPYLFPVYRPLFMHRVTESGGDTAGYEPEEGKPFVFRGGLFNRITEEEAAAYTDRYKQQVQIKHYREEQFTSFRPGQDPESLVFPFQTVFTLMADNAKEEVYLYNAIRTKNNDTDGVWECILLLPQKSDAFFYNNMKGKYANRSKLCPPDCSILPYEVEIFR